MKHQPVLLQETLQFLQVHPAGIYVDATVGGGGHTAAIAERLQNGQVIGFDCDLEALSRAEIRLNTYGERVKLIHTNFKNLSESLGKLAIPSIDGVLFDLGVSSFQLDTPGRGFSFRFDAPLDMRMDSSLPHKASDIVNRYTAQQLETIFHDYGEERWAKQIAHAIVRTRMNHPIQSTAQLARLVEQIIPIASRRHSTIHPATRAFQALRLEVNDELENLGRGLNQAWAHLKVGGHLVVISFHSLEDRITKQFLREKASTCVCPPDFPVCTCHKIQELEAWGPILPSEAEIAANPRSRSAKLRAATKLA
ncbi:16S rRNA (cytosine(1402)-N(4))-methyltransferase RsmH [Candidatus Acetothermia bacterium]|nr:16S rRNA (cytosine(1402)-N(4))-methyltransferase RsmH [Candidatus Acetothermia bacterium]